MWINKDWNVSIRNRGKYHRVSTESLSLNSCDTSFNQSKDIVLGRCPGLMDMGGD